MRKVKSDFYNAIFNGELQVPEAEVISLNAGYLDMIDPCIVTRDNVWNICVLLSMVTKNTGTSVLCRQDVMAIDCQSYSGIDVVNEVKALTLAAQASGRLVTTIDRIYGMSELAKRWEDTVDDKHSES